LCYLIAACCQFSSRFEFPTEQEIDEAERGWVDYLANKGEAVGDETTKVHYRFNERGEVVDAVVVEESKL
jgi:hypothetical protein